MNPLETLKNFAGGLGRPSGNGNANGNGNGHQQSDMHLGEPGFLRKVVRRRSLESVFLFVTAKCNSKCRTCFYASEMDKGPDLTFDQIRRLSDTAPKFDKLWLSGGEPVLRDELVDILEMFHRQNGVKTINFPTNGIATDKIERAVEQLLQRCPDLNVHLNFSFDGMSETHDRIRGVKGGFAKTLASVSRIEERFGGSPKLHCNAATVVTPENLDDLRPLAEYLLGSHKFATHVFEIMRGEPRDPSIGRVDQATLERAHADLMPLYETMAERLFGPLPPGGRHLAVTMFLGTLRFLYDVQEQNTDRPTPWPMDCTAGETTFVVDHEGSFRSCELRPPIGNLADYDFNLSAAHQSAVMKQEIADLGGGHRANCWCTHGCWILSSLKFSPKVLLWEIPRAYLRVRRSRPSGGYPPLRDPQVLATQYHLPR